MTPDHIPDFTPTLHVFAAWVAFAIAVLATAIGVGIGLAIITGLHALAYLVPTAAVIGACFYFLRD